MALSIREALKFGGLFGARVIAGEDRLDNVIDSISVLEVADRTISRWVIQDQLYITSFYAISSNIEMQKTVIRTLAECGCCGLVLCHFGLWINEVGPDVIALCNRVHFPLIVARPEASYIDILNPIISTLLHDHREMCAPDDYSSIRNDFIDLLINEDDPLTVLKTMTERVNKPISYYDIYGGALFSSKDKKRRQAEAEFVRQEMNHLIHACAQQAYALETIMGT